MKTFYTFCILISFTIQPISAQDGTLDKTFGNGGLVTKQVGQDTIWPGSSGTAVAVSSTGKIVVGGIANNIRRSYETMVTSFNADGTFDSNFGDSGIWFSPVARSKSKDIHIGKDDKIYVTGNASPTYGTNEIYIHRLLPNGTSDNTYGTNGYITYTDPDELTNMGASEMMDNGQIVTGGGGYSHKFARFNNDGSFDKSFNGGKISVVEVGGLRAILEDIAVQKDGKILATGRYKKTTYSDTTLTYVLRITKEGVLDNTFANNGVLLHQFSDFYLKDFSYGKAIAVQADGKILVAGYITSIRKFLGRLNPNGTLDPTFGDKGIVYIEHGDNIITGQIDLIKVLVQPDGKIIVTGTFPRMESGNGELSDFYVERFLPDGKVDKDFGLNGMVTTDFGLERRDDCWAAIPQKDGKIVLVGSSRVASGYTEVSVARYNSGLDSWPPVVVGISENQQRLSLEIYPNPAKHQFTVQLPQNANGIITVKVSNMLGQTVYSIEQVAGSRQNIEIKTDRMERGIYMVTLKSDKVSYSGKVIVAR
jgi:uncharacterized delta-60 repeat protein